MRDFGLNFFVWWYMVKLPAWGKWVWEKIIYILDYTNTLVMAKYLTTPLFQDNSGIGKGISFIIRALWVWWGGMLSALFAIPLVIGLVVLAVLPPLVIYFIFTGIFL